MSDAEVEDDRDDLDGCEINFADYEDDEETQLLRPLFPEGVPDPELAEKYRVLATIDQLPPSDDVPTTGSPE